MVNKNKEAVKFWVPIVAVIVTIIAFGLTVAERTRINNAVYARNPNVEFLTPFTIPVEDAFTVVIPIRNSSTSELAIAHRVQVTIMFNGNNAIRDIDLGPFRLIDGENGDSSISFETNILYPLSVVYPAVIVEKEEIPIVSVSWAEKTGWQSIPLVR